MDNPSAEGVKVEPVACPFCGGPAKIIRPMGDHLYGRKEPPYYGEEKYRVVCAGLYEEPIRRCLGIYATDTEVEAIAAWNTRASLPSPPMSEAGEVRIRDLEAWKAEAADLIVKHTTQIIKSDEALTAAQEENARLRKAITPLLEQWRSYLESDLNHECAHSRLVRYELWERLDAALNPPAAKVAE